MFTALQLQDVSAVNVELNYESKRVRRRGWEWKAASRSGNINLLPRAR